LINKNQIFSKNYLINYLIVLLGGSLCVSVFISDLIIFSILILWFKEGSFIDKWQKIKTNKFSLSIIVFIIFYIIGLIWGEINLDAWKWISKQSLLLIIPVLLSTSIKSKYIKYSLYSFLIGMFINSIIAIGCYLRFWSINYHHYPEEIVAIGFLDHFDHSVFLAFSALIIIQNLFYETKNLRNCIIYIILLLVFLTALFLSHGRAGQYAFVLFLGLLLIVKFYQSYIRIIVSISILAAGLIIINNSSNTFNNRLNSIITESKNFFHLLEYSSTNTSELTVTDTPMGDRLTYLINYTTLIKKNLLLGCGTGKSLKEYNNLKNKIFPNLIARPPHNNYLFVLAEVGLVGLILWLNIFIQLFVEIYKKNDLKPSLVLKLFIPMLFLLICLTDEYLVRHNPTLFFCFFTTLFCVNAKVNFKL